MEKKKKKEVVGVVGGGVEIAIVPTPVPKAPRIAPLTLDFGREDLNQLKDKVNELITRANE